MWSTVKTEAIILASEPWREADRKYRALSPNFGKIEFIGRGARKGKAKLAPHLEPFSVLTLELVRGARGTTVIGVERQRAFAHLRDSLDARCLALATTAFIDQALRPEAEDPALYDELIEIFSVFNQHTDLPYTRTLFVFGGFMLRLLRHLGYDVQLGHCVSCKDQILPLSFRWHEGRGGLVCSHCVMNAKEEWFRARSIEEETVTMLRFARDAGYRDLLRPALKAGEVNAFAACVNDVFRSHVPGYGEDPYWSHFSFLEEKKNSPVTAAVATA